MFSSAHKALIESLNSESTWGGLSLRYCLERLRDGGPTQWRDVTVLEAWSTQDNFCVIYEKHGLRIGVRAHRDTPGDSPFWFDREVHGQDPSPEVFGVEIADYAIAEPLGTFREKLVLDEGGVGWWGDPPLPAVR